MTMDDNEPGKLFVGGLSWETSKEALQEYFNQYGEVVDCVVMMNNETGRSRGFGFVTFKDPNCINVVLQNKPHELHGRTIDAKECTPRSMQKNKRGGGGSGPGKVFLGGLPPDITESDIRHALSKFGKVTQVSIMSDQETKKCRGFGFISFESEDSTEEACGARFVNINGKQIECKRAEPRERRNPGQQQYGMPNQNGSGGAMNYGNAAAGYQAGWNQPQPYPAQGQAYGNYQNYNAPYGGAPAAMPYNAAPQAAAYDQTGYAANYGYGYAQPAAGGYSQPAAGGYSQPAAGGYGQPAAPAYPAATNYAAVPEAKGAAPAAGGYGGGYQNTGRGGGQGYHPYRR